MNTLRQVEQLIFSDFFFTFNIKETGLTLTLRGEFPVLASIKDGYQQNRSQDIQTSSQNFTLGFHECYSWLLMMAQFSKRSRAAVVLYPFALRVLLPPLYVHTGLRLAAGVQVHRVGAVIC